MPQPEEFNQYSSSLTTEFESHVKPGCYIEVANSGRRGEQKRFNLGLAEILSALRDIENNLTSFAVHQEYNEDNWRHHARDFSNRTIRSFLTVQTKPFFTTLSKLIGFANGGNTNAYNDQHMVISQTSIENTINYVENLIQDCSPAERQDELAIIEGAGTNLIVYGAPGSGKSYYVERIVTGQKHIRTVFHPEYQNSDFVGGLRPAKEGDAVTYRYIPGPFIEALLLADQNPQDQCFLVIEEINRANAAAVFGEIFQLLDRRDDGTSVYSISADELLREYLESVSYTHGGNIVLPTNLSLVATMNSSDQGVFLLDSAFKRRWEFRYCTIDYTEHQANPSFDEARVPYHNLLLSWTDFATSINDVLKEQEVEEDRLIGPYFLSDAERKDAETCKSAVGGKLFIYLWDDVLRHGMRSAVFDEKYKTFSSVINDYNKGHAVFNTRLDSMLKSRSESASPAVEEVDQAPADESGGD